MSNIEEIGEEFDMKIAQEAQPKLKVKPTIPIEEVPEHLRGRPVYTDEHLENLANILQERIQQNMPAQVVPRKAVMVTDFKNITHDDIYNPDIYFEAKPFMSSDFLRLSLKDKEYEPRWVNKKSERLGHMLAIGYSYVDKEDIEGRLEVEIQTDASGHFSFHDVVLMKIPKSRYYPALRAAHQRAQAVVNSQKASQAGQTTAATFMQRTAGDEYNDAAAARTMQFYQPQ